MVPRQPWGPPKDEFAGVLSPDEIEAETRSLFTPRLFTRLNSSVSSFTTNKNHVFYLKSKP